LARVRSPVGLEIGAESPAEIAVAIVGEIVAERHPTILRTSSRDARATEGSKNVVTRTP